MQISIRDNSTDRRRLLLRVIAPAFPAFNIYSRFARRMTALGPVCIATAAHEVEGWDVEVIDENNYRQFGPRDEHGRPDHEALQDIRPADIIGLYGGLTSTIPRLYEVANLYRKRGVPIIAGGQHFCAENITDALDNGVDVIVAGEGEITIQDILRRMQDGKRIDDVSGIAYLQDGQLVRTPERPPIVDFESMPLPDFSLLRNTCVRVYPLSWTRGCGMNCEFCTVKGKPRSSSPERVFRQVTSLVEKHNARFFFIVDDLFGQHRSDALKFLSLVTAYQQKIRTRLKFNVQIRLDKARDTELLTAMRAAGVRTVCIGFESPIEEELVAMKKKLKPEEMIALARIYHKFGFFVHGMFIFGYPLVGKARFTMPERQRVRRFRKFIKAAKIDTVQVLLPVPLPGTEMTERIRKAGRLYSRDHVGWEYYDGNFPCFEPDPPLSPEELHRASMKIMGRFYQFRYMFAVAMHVLMFPGMVFSLHDVRSGWRRWHHGWRISIIRFGGWVTIRQWLKEFKKGVFSRKLTEAKRLLIRHDEKDQQDSPSHQAR